MSGYDQPMPVGDKFAVRIRRVPLQRDFAGMTWVGFRITHPNGRKRLGPSDFPMRESAERYAHDKGWTVIGAAP